MTTELQTREQQLMTAINLPDTYQQYLENLDPVKRSSIYKSVGHMRHGMHNVAPMMCTGPGKCLFKAYCPVVPRDEAGGYIYTSTKTIDYGPLDDYPVGRSCVMEALDMSQRVLDYAMHLQVDINNPIEMSIVQELAIIDLMKQRALRILSQGDRNGEGQDFMKQDITGFDEYGNKATKTQLHPVVDLIDKWEKRREKWLDRLLETRKSKTDMAVRLGQNRDDSKMLRELAELRQLLVGDLKNKQLTMDDEEILLDDK